MQGGWQPFGGHSAATGDHTTPHEDLNPYSTLGATENTEHSPWLRRRKSPQELVGEHPLLAWGATLFSVD